MSKGSEEARRTIITTHMTIETDDDDTFMLHLMQ